ncbi:MAG: hypothetical protein ACR2QE_15515 [Acidimicrobiales bacterium]
MVESPNGSVPATGRYGAAAVATVTMALVTWPIAFNLGAYGEVFYSDVFSFVVAATVALLVASVASPYEGRRRWLVQVALAGPVIWLLLSVVLFDSTAAAASHGVFGLVGLAVAVVSIPMVLKLLIDMFVPDFIDVPNTRRLVFFVGVIVAVALAGLAVGANNDAFLTCDDFRVAGSDEPANCRSG